MRLILFAITASILTGCFSVVMPLGQVVHKKVACTSDTECKTKIARACPSGANLHNLRQAVEVEFSCKM